MNKIVTLLSSLILLFGLIACSSEKQTYFIGDIHIIQEEQLKVDCSDEIEDAGNFLVGYLCNVKISEQTKIINENNQNLSVNDLKEGQTVKVVLEKTKNITKEDREVTAKEIVLLN
jgi:hypothetical protein